MGWYNAKIKRLYGGGINMRFYILAFIFVLFMITPIMAAELETYDINKTISIVKPARLDGAISTGITCNITILNPNSATVIKNVLMTNNIDYHNYSVAGSSNMVEGIYNYFITCYQGNLSATRTFQYQIKRGGYMDNSRIFFILLFVAFAVILSIMSLVFKRTILNLIAAVSLFILVSILWSISWVFSTIAMVLGLYMLIRVFID